MKYAVIILLLAIWLLIVLVDPFHLSQRLWAFPAPSQSWVDLIIGLAWPMVALFALIRYASDIRAALDALVPRFRTDNVKVAGVELTRQMPHTDEVNSWFAWSGQPGNNEKLVTWLQKHCSPAPNETRFITQPEYASLRAQAATELGVPNG